MGVKGGPNIPFWDSFNTILDPSSNILYPGFGFTFSNPLGFKSASDWTMTDNTNLIAGIGVSRYVKQTSKQQFTQRVVQVLSGSSDKYTLFFSYKVAKTGTDSTIMQINSNNLTFTHSAAGEMTMRHHNVDFPTSGLGMTDDVWRMYAFTRSGTAATMYVNGSIFTTFSGLSANTTSAVDTKVFDYIGCDGAVGFIWFNLGQALSSQQIKTHYDAFKGRFRLS
jgi:hypothetical protein